MDPKDSASVTAVRSDFLAETCGDSSVTDRKILSGDPFVAMERSDWLLRGRYQIFLFYIGILLVLATFPDDLMMQLNAKMFKMFSTPEELSRINVKLKETMKNFSLGGEGNPITMEGCSKTEI